MYEGVETVLAQVKDGNTDQDEIDSTLTNLETHFRNMPWIVQALDMVEKLRNLLAQRNQEMESLND